jgi:hypothetical protein
VEVGGWFASRSCGREGVSWLAVVRLGRGGEGRGGEGMVSGGRRVQDACWRVVLGLLLDCPVLLLGVGWVLWSGWD